MRTRTTMLSLFLVSLVWAFSFGLTKGRLTGIDSAWVSALRIALAAGVFTFVWRPSLGSLAGWLRLAAIGAVQFGLMYLCLIESYQHLQSYEVALFTLTTPVLLALFDSLIERAFNAKAWGAAGLAVVAGALVTLKSQDVHATLHGLLLVQGSNACFAAGQILYRRERLRWPQARDHELFAALYLGALVVTLPLALVHTSGVFPVITGAQWGTLAYLGVIASGFCFFLWNRGATRVGTATLAVMNNAKVPLAIACSMLVFGETGDPLRLGAAFALMIGAAFWAQRP